MYCNSISGYSRLLTREVPIGDVPVGGDNPIRVQSMTNTPTLDTRATVNQAIRMIETGCEYVRITVPGIKEAENLAFIKKELLKKGYHTPLIADIHFNPAVAEIAARLVEKVRINPGNYADKKQFHEIAFTDSEYTAELERIRERLHPLIRICKEYGTALRIGSNHGSLSDRILSRFGDTPEGMAESAMEFIRICEDLEFHNIVLSMKSSNVRVMVQATRLLVSKMQQGNTVYPLHLGVTEAGDAEEGRIKSAAGICTLLTDGIGDTIRVSLTEEPEKEIPVAKALVKYIEKFKNTPHFTKNEALPFNPFAYARRKTKPIVNIGGALPPVVISHTKKIPEGVHVFDNDSVNIVAAFRNFISQKDAEKDTSPVIIKRKYSGLGLPDFIITAAADCTPLFIDGLADGLCLQAEGIEDKICNQTAYDILQASRARFSKTEYIACPSCGRTQFNIIKTLQEIKQRTSHLPGLKIGVMGCIVNGPGEMADADYGYVGAGKGKITLYKGKQIIQKNIPEAKAVDALIIQIKAFGDWKE